MPREATLQLEDMDGRPMEAPVRVVFEDDEWSALTRFSKYARQVAETPIMHNPQGVSTSIRLDFTTGTQSYNVTLPQPRRDDCGHVDGWSWARVKFERAETLRLGKQVIYGGLRRLADRGRMANRSLKRLPAGRVAGIELIDARMTPPPVATGKRRRYCEAGVDRVAA